MKKLLIFLLILSCGTTYGQSGSGGGLFEDDAIININLTFNIDGTISDLDERNEHAGILSYTNSSGEQVDIDLKISVRGKTRSNPRVCRFPPLELNFKKKGNTGNIFEGQDKVKLVTHCNSAASYDQYVINEYLIYKSYNLLTDKSLKVRLLRVNYIDSAGKESPFERLGFLIEDIDVLAARHNMVEVEKKLPSQDMCDHSVLDIFTVFQFMIGNTDWSISSLHNAKLIGFEDGKSLTPIPYDFDYSGIISTSYAQAPGNLPIESVEERIFRGFCRQSGAYEEIFALFQENKEEIYNTYLSNEILNDRNKKRIEKYLDGFYAVLDNPKRSAREINGACRIDHVHMK